VKGLILFLLLLSPLASAQEPSVGIETGNQLYALCTMPESSAKHVQAGSECLGYALGLAHAFDFLGAIDLPDGVTEKQIQDVVVKYLANNPGSRNRTSQYLAFLALGKAFPNKR
jgi:hypothetical protein